jgi:hypothetical protein
MGVHSLGGRSGPEKFGRLRVAFGVRLFAKGQVFAVGLGFPGKGI